MGKQMNRRSIGILPIAAGATKAAKANDEDSKIELFAGVKTFRGGTS